MSRFKNKVFSESTLPVSREVPQEKKDDDKEINKDDFATEISILGKPEDISVNINHSSGVETEEEDVSDDHHEDDQGDPENNLGDPEAIKWKKRQQWDKSIEFLFSCISMSVGLGNQLHTFQEVNHCFYPRTPRFRENEIPNTVYKTWCQRK